MSGKVLEMLARRQAFTSTSGVRAGHVEDIARFAGEDLEGLISEGLVQAVHVRYGEVAEIGGYYLTRAGRGVVRA